MARNAFKLLDDLSDGIADLKTALAPFAAFGETKSAARRGPRRRTRTRRAAKAMAPAAKPRVTRKRVSAAVRAKRVLQGKYLGAIRPLSKQNRSQVKKIYAAKGPVAAVRLALNLRKAK